MNPAFMFHPLAVFAAGFFTALALLFAAMVVAAAGYRARKDSGK